MSRFPLPRLPAIAALAALMGAPAQARDLQVGALRIGQPWVQPPPPDAHALPGMDMH